MGDAGRRSKDDRRGSCNSPVIEGAEREGGLERESERDELMETSVEGFGKTLLPDFSNLTFPFFLNAKRLLFLQAVRSRMNG